jgi:hypothetical protein
LVRLQEVSLELSVPVDSIKVLKREVCRDFSLHIAPDHRAVNNHQQQNHLQYQLVVEEDLD